MLLLLFTGGGARTVVGTATATLLGFTGVGAGARKVPRRGGGGKFASGKYALGECDRCAASVKLVALKSLVVNKTKTGLLVCTDCWEEDHPQYRVGENVPVDGEALRNPRPARSFS